MGDINQVSVETLNLMKGTGVGGIWTGGQLAKSGVTTSTGLTGYNLESVARSLVPFASPERNRIPRKVSPTGTVANFKVIKSVNQSGTLSRLEGQKGAALSYNTSPVAFPFKSFGVSDQVTREALAAAKGFEDDLFAKQHTFALLRCMTEEEKLIVGGNTTTGLANTAAPTVTPSGTGGTIAAGTYSVKVAALTLVAANRTGALDIQQANLSLGGVLGNTSSIVGGLVNSVDGCTAASSSTSTGVLSGSTNSIVASVTPVTGAVAYAWYCGVAGSETLQIVTTISAVTLTALVAGGDAVSTISVNGSADPLAFDGYIPQIIAGGGYYTDLGGTQTLHKSSAGVQELDNLNAYLYKQYKLGPSRYLCGVQAFGDITNAIVSTGGAPVVYMQNQASEKANLVGGYRVRSYVNKSYQGQEIELIVHPWLPAQTIIALTDTIPYPSADIPSTWEMELGFDYLAEDYAPQSPTLPFAISAYGALKGYFPASCGIITNFKAGIS